MMEITGSASKIEGLVQILVEGNYRILEMARTGRMAMRRGHHTSRVLEALGDTTPRIDPKTFSGVLKHEAPDLLEDENHA